MSLSVCRRGAVQALCRTAERVWCGSCSGRSGRPGADAPTERPMPDATLTISSRNYSSWSLRGWLLCRMADLDFEEDVVPLDEPTARAELLLLSPSVLVPQLTHGKVKVWDTLAIAEYLNEIKPEAQLWPADLAARAHALAVSGEMHSGFANLRSALPMNLKARYS